MTQSDDTEGRTTGEDEASAEKKPSRFAWVSKIPAHLPGGLRTTTLALGVLFFLVLILWNAVRYDPTLNENSPVYVPPTTTTDVVPTQEYTPTRTPTTTPSVTPTPSVTTTVPDDGTGGEGATTGSTAPPTTTSTAPGFQLPTIPGLQLPGQAPTTTPNR